MNTGPPHNQQPQQPFGYSFDFPQDYLPSELPVPGPSLLNHNEDEYINNFLRQQQQSQQLPGSNETYQQTLQMQDHLGGGDMTHFDWLDSNHQIPTFIGASATPKPPMSSPQHMPSGYGLQMNTNFSYPTYNHGNEMMASSHQDLMAASILNSTASSQPPHNPRMSARVMGSAPAILESIEHLHTPGALPTESYLAQSMSAEVDYGPSLLGLNPLNTAQPLSYDGPHTAPPRIEAPINERLYQFGSDSHFTNANFIPQSEAETDQYVSERLTTELHQLKPINRSNDVTRQSSPVHQSESKPSLDSLGQRSSGDDVNQGSKPKRKRKDSQEEMYGAKNKARRASQNPRLQRVSSADNGHKRRRSSLTGTKQPRENLSEEQKRNNHIQSEQKRRNLIKDGFDKLHTLVPELRSGGLSKSQVLNEAGNFLAQLIHFNQMAEEKLKMRNGQNGG